MSTEYRIRISERAMADLQSIFDYIRMDSPQNASGMIEKIIDAIDSLRTFPQRHGSPRGVKSTEKTLRSMVVRPYLVRYRIHDLSGSVHILHVRHGARKN